MSATRRRGFDKVPLIVERLTDKQMLQYMGRENLEDYNASFLIQLESWEAALKSGMAAPERSGVNIQPIEIAKLLGWVELGGQNNTTQMNSTARACHAAYGLIAGGYMAREDFAELTVAAAR